MATKLTTEEFFKDLKEKLFLAVERVMEKAAEMFFTVPPPQSLELLEKLPEGLSVDRVVKKAWRKNKGEFRIKMDAKGQSERLIAERRNKGEVQVKMDDKGQSKIITEDFKQAFEDLMLNNKLYTRKVFWANMGVVQQKRLRWMDGIQNKYWIKIFQIERGGGRFESKWMEILKKKKKGMRLVRQYSVS